MEKITYHDALSARLAAISPEELDAFAERCAGTVTLALGEEITEDVAEAMFPDCVAGKVVGTMGFTTYFVDPSHPVVRGDMKTETLTPVVMTKAERDALIDKIPPGGFVPRIVESCLGLDGFECFMSGTDWEGGNEADVPAGYEMTGMEPERDDEACQGTDYDDNDAALLLASRGATIAKVRYEVSPRHWRLVEVVRVGS
jgi:hypothetical protein